MMGSQSGNKPGVLEREFHIRRLMSVAASYAKAYGDSVNLCEYHAALSQQVSALVVPGQNGKHGPSVAEQHAATAKQYAAQREQSFNLFLQVTAEIHGMMNQQAPIRPPLKLAEDAGEAKGE